MTGKPSRRSVLAAGAAAWWAPMIERALATPASGKTGTIADVEHVVILMQENRAFDHYFGTLRGVRGFADPRPLTLPSGKSVFHQPLGPGVEEALLPFRFDAATTSAQWIQSLDHSWKAQNSLWRNHDAWAPVKGPLTMGHFTREDIPFYYALADAFTVCDAYHCSLFGPTTPNRMFLFSGSNGVSAGHSGPHSIMNVDDGNWTADASHDDKAFPPYEWTSYAERLQAAGVSWKVYQEYDAFGDNPLAWFAAYRGLAETDPLYQRARTWVDGSTRLNAAKSHGEHLVAAFAKDVAADALPQVSWIVAPYHACEHPDAAPGWGEAFTGGLIAALAAHPEVFAKTAFILNYDENDGFFDHMPPPVPATLPAMGASTVSTHGESFDGEAMGLGPRVPAIIVSPWTRGGWVNSQLFDHTSVIRFLELRFNVQEPNISPWRRAVTGDLTSAFDFAGGEASVPKLPDPSAAGARADAALKLPAPKVPTASQALPKQEPGSRPSRALPYSLHTHGVVVGGGLKLTLINDGAAGAHFSGHTPGAVAGPWAYTVEAGKTLTAAPLPAGAYDLTVYGPNGFLRHFAGVTPGLEVEARYEPEGARVTLVLSNPSPAQRVAVVRPRAYLKSPPRRLALAPGGKVEDVWLIGPSGGWYDLEVTDAHDSAFRRRLAGRMETGKPSVSDPLIGG
jgi:phospholipase C